MCFRYRCLSNATRPAPYPLLLHLLTLPLSIFILKLDHHFHATHFNSHGIAVTHKTHKSSPVQWDFPFENKK